MGTHRVPRPHGAHTLLRTLDELAVMGLATRIIPTLLMRGDKLVKGRQFKSWRTVGLVEQAMQIHQARGVDELILLDIEATPAGRGPDLKRIERLTSGLFTPVTVGGGVRSVQDVKDLLNAGADKVAIGSAATDHETLHRMAEAVGCQAIVVALDVSGDEEDWHIRTHCGRNPIYGDEPERWAQVAQMHGAGEIVLTSIDREGTMAGYDLELIRQVAQAVSIPVIAHGGCKSYEDMAAAIGAGAHAVAAGALFQFTDATPRGAAEYLATLGVETRTPV
jgi:cyclase